MAQQVDVKGFGLVEFPDNIERSVMLDALRRKFSQINQGQAVANSTAEPYNPSLAERAASAISSGLQKTGLISDNYRANRIGQNITMGLESLPVIGDAIGGDELGRAIREGDLIGGGFAALGAIPIAGDAAKAAGRNLPDEIKDLITEKTRFFHGTGSDFEQFSGEFKAGGKLGKGFYFADNPAKANLFAKIRKQKDPDATPNIRTANLDIKNPYVINSEMDLPVGGVDTDKLAQAGYDSVVLKKGDKIDEVVVFNQQQIIPEFTNQQQN